MKIEFEPFKSKEEILICRVFGRINEKSADKLLESFKKTVKGLSVLVVLDQVSEIDGAGFQAFSKISTEFVKKMFVKKVVFCCSLTNKQLQKILGLAGFSETYQLFETEPEAMAKLQIVGD